jgi:hypothetical protein
MHEGLADAIENGGEGLSLDEHRRKLADMCQSGMDLAMSIPGNTATGPVPTNATELGADLIKNEIIRRYR